MSTTLPLRTPSGLADRVQLFHALSDETRLAILCMLRGGERCVCDLQDDLDAAQSRLSFHLKVLREAGLVRDRKEGRWSYYAVNADRLADTETYVSELRAPRIAKGSVSASPILHHLTKAPPTGLTRARKGIAIAKATGATKAGAKGLVGDGCCG
ncbi:MAG: winged helix-turn-helix transcriptional regulator [Gemmatimonadales bacterium]|nr:winged helix-turn-helix transcriptional regulator [Gemmatimonadales bacterium]